MNRVIKFRAWDKKASKMRVVWDIGWKGWDHPDEVLNYVKVEDNGTNDLLENEVELMQFTGLHDKNGKEIYEGDYVGGIWDGYIAYCDKQKSLQLFFSFGCAGCEGDVHWYDLIEDDGKLEVIGNIYENPELLKTE